METRKTTKTTKQSRIKKISADFEFDMQYVEKCNPHAAACTVDVFEKLRAESVRRDGWSDSNCLFLFGTWCLGKEIRIGQYDCASTRVTIENVWNEENAWEHDRAVCVNRILKECPDVFIRDFAIGTVKIIDAIKNDKRLKEAKFRVSFRISYTETKMHSHDSSRVVYDSTDGFIC